MADGPGEVGEGKGLKEGAGWFGCVAARGQGCAAHVAVLGSAHTVCGLRACEPLGWCLGLQLEKLGETLATMQGRLAAMEVREWVADAGGCCCRVN